MLILEIAAGIVLALIVIVCWQIVLILALVGAVLFGLAMLYVASPEGFSIAMRCLAGGAFVLVTYCLVREDYRSRKNETRLREEYRLVKDKTGQRDDVRDDHGRS